MDEVVAAVQFRDCVFVFTRAGRVYKMEHDFVTQQLQFTLMIELFPREP
jgi:hypothetical protein